MSVENDYEQQLEDQISNSVYDFLYHDARRIAAFLAQFETYGVLQGIKSQESVGRSSTTKASANAGVDIATLAKGGMAIDGTFTDEDRDAAERTYDPLWRNAIALLDYLAERELIVRQIKGARIGQFVLMTGQLAAFDVGILREAWKLPAIKKSIVANASAQEKANSSSPSMNRYDRRKANLPRTDQPSDTEAALELIPLLPHSVQGAITAGDITAWFNLREESLVISSSELLLKHGIGVAVHGAS